MAYMKDKSGRRLDSFVVSPPAANRTSVPSFTVNRLGVTYTVPGGATAAPYWPQIINVQGKVPAPLGKYYRLRSTDHSTGAGGLWVDYADSPTATSWTSMTSGTTSVYADAVQGSQSETFQALYCPWLDAALPWYVYYQNAGAGVGQQQTILAKTADFVTFTRHGIVLDVPSLTAQPGDGHMGYFSAHLDGARIFGPSLCGGTTQYHHVMNESFDGKTFFTDPRRLSTRTDWLTITGDRLFNFTNVKYINWRGRNIVIGAARSMVTGASRHSRVVWAPISSDYRQLLAPPQVIFEPTESYERPDVVSYDAFVEDGRIILTCHYDAGQILGPGTGESGTTQAILAAYELTGL